MPSTQDRPSKRRRSSTQKQSPGAVETRSALMDSALRHFGSSGFLAASVHDIARDAGVNVSLVSYHFGGKEGLFKACLERAGSDQLNVAVRILSKEPETLDELKIRLEMFIDEMFLYGLSNPDMFAILYRDLNSEFHLVEDIFKKTFLNVFDLLSKFFETAKTGKLIADWTDPNLSAMQLMGSVTHTLKSDSIREKIFKRSIKDPEVRTSTRNYIVKSHLLGLTVRP